MPPASKCRFVMFPIQLKRKPSKHFYSFSRFLHRKQQQQFQQQQQQQLQQKQQQNDDFANRKFAGVLMSQQNLSAQKLPLPKVILQKLPLTTTNNAIGGSSSSATPIVLHKQPLFAGQQTTILTASGTMTITSTTAPTLPHPMHPQAGLAENKISIVPIQPIVAPVDDQTHSLPTTPSMAITIAPAATSPTAAAVSIETTPTKRPETVKKTGETMGEPALPPTKQQHPADAGSSLSVVSPCLPTGGDVDAGPPACSGSSFASVLSTDVGAEQQQTATDQHQEPTIETTPIVSVTAKERKRRIIIDDDDESPTFNPLSRSNKRLRGRGRKGRGGLMRYRKMHLLTSPEKAAATAAALTPAASTNSTVNITATDSDIFTSPEGIVSIISFGILSSLSTPLFLSLLLCVRDSGAQRRTILFCRAKTTNDGVLFTPIQSK